MNYASALTGTFSDSNGFTSTRQIEYHVDGALGDDSNAGTVDSPFKTIHAAINAADESNNAGENHIFVNAGVYNETLQISDDDLLTITGVGGNPWDVLIDATSANGGMSNVINVVGGEELQLINLQVSGGANNGVKVTGIEKFLMTDVFSTHNSNGLSIEDVEIVALRDCRFFFNSQYGVIGTNMGTFACATSHFHDNYFGGAKIIGAQNANFVRSNFVRNGLPVSVPASLNSNGLELEDVETFRIFGGHFDDNRGNGIRAHQVNTIDISDVRASGNHLNGGHFTGFNEFTSKGGIFGLNEGYGAMIAQGTGYASTVKIIGDYFYSNQIDGLSVNNCWNASLLNATARSNQMDGVALHGVHNVSFENSNFIENEFHGATIVGASNVELSSVYANNNERTGVYLVDCESNLIENGSFSGNGHWGIHLLSSLIDYSADIVIKHALIENNWEGLKVEYVTKVELIGGNYSNNYAHGIQLNNFETAALSDVTATFNGGSGARFNLGRTDGNSTQQNFNEVIINGGFYGFNGHQGIELTTKYDYLRKGNKLLFSATSVNASNNHRDGLGFVDRFNQVVSRELPDNEPKYGTATIRLDGGTYKNNGQKGISIFGISAGKCRRQVNVHVDSVNVYGNERGGMFIRAEFTDIPEYRSNQPLEDTWIKITNSNFDNNDGTGLSIRIEGALSQYEFQSIALIEGVHAKQNKYTGLSINSGLSDEAIPNANIRVIDSVFRENGHDGVSVKTQDISYTPLPQFEGILSWLPSNTPTEFYGTNVPNLEFVDVYASYNGSHGIDLVGPRDDEFHTWTKPHVTILRGAAVENELNGINVSRMSSLSIEETYVLFNESKGVYTWGVTDVDVEQANIHGNGSVDLHII